MNIQIYLNKYIHWYKYSENGSPIVLYIHSEKLKLKFKKINYHTHAPSSCSLYQGRRMHQEVNFTPLTEVTKVTKVIVFFGLSGWNQKVNLFICQQLKKNENEKKWEKLNFLPVPVPLQVFCQLIFHFSCWLYLCELL